MTINTVVPDPEKIMNSYELESILSRIVEYQKERKCLAGVLMIQRTQFAAYYRIKCEEEANKMIINRGKYEWGLKFYPLSYFEVLKNSKEFLACSKTIE